MKDIIINIVESSQGIKGVDLALKVMSLVNPQKFDSGIFASELVSLVTSGEILEIEYILPEMNYRVKSFYLSKGTKICANENWHLE